jgi:integrase/recombinase XerD
MKSERPIRNLVSDILRELERLNYSENTRNGYRRLYRQVIDFADGTEESIYSEGLGNRFLRSSYKFDLDSYTVSSHRTFRNQTRCIRVLGDYQLHGAILRRRTTKIPHERTPQFAEALKAYYKECEQRNYSAQGMRGRIYRVELFINYMDDHGITSLSLLTSRHLSDYIRTRRRLSQKVHFGYPDNVTVVLKIFVPSRLSRERPFCHRTQTETAALSQDPEHF